MGRWNVAIAVLAVMCLASATARADLTSNPSETLTSTLSHPSGTTSGLYELLAGRHDAVDTRVAQRGSSDSGVHVQVDADQRTAPLTAVAPRHVGAGRSETSVMTVPPAPSSLKLILSGLVSLGAVQLARSMRQVHLADLPEWYHTACPERIGDAVPLDLDHTTPPLCLFERPAIEPDRSLRPRPVLVAAWQPVSQTVVTLTAPRSPPQLS